MNDILLDSARHIRLLLKCNLVHITQQHFLSNPIWLSFGFILILLFFIWFHMKKLPTVLKGETERGTCRELNSW